MRPPMTTERATELVRGRSCGAMIENREVTITTDPAKVSCKVTKLIPNR